MDLFKDKQIADSTKSLYIKNLKRLNGGNDIKSIKFLDDMDDILKKISKYAPTTQRSYIISICSLLKNKKNTRYDDYFKLLTSMNNDLKVNTSKSDSQKKNWMDYDEIKKIYDDKKNKLFPLPKKLKKKEFIELRDFMVFSLYMLTPPRRNKDYQIMVLSNKMDDKDYNYLLDKTFIFNNYKTKKTYNEVKQDIPDDLMSVIEIYLKHHPRSKELKKKKYLVPFLVDEEGEPLKHINSITSILNKQIGKKIGVSMLRNIYLTHKHGDAQEELENDVAAMGTSTNTATNHYIKKD
tara:strand:+ start:3923 stop:4804 length:882 start_codon:yes stop_codon:yes gene_type:complete